MEAILPTRSKVKCARHRLAAYGSGNSSGKQKIHLKPMKYAPEMLMAILAFLRNIALIAACAWTVVRLYQASGSWHSLWALLMLLFMVAPRFIRD